MRKEELFQTSALFQIHEIPSVQIKSVLELNVTTIDRASNFVSWHAAVFRRRLAA